MRRIQKASIVLKNTYSVLVPAHGGSAQKGLVSDARFRFAYCGPCMLLREGSGVWLLPSMVRLSCVHAVD